MLKSIPRKWVRFYTLQAVPEQVEIFSTETLFHGRGIVVEKEKFSYSNEFLKR